MNITFRLELEDIFNMINAKKKFKNWTQKGMYFFY